MKLIAEIDDETHEVEIRREGDRMVARLGDRRYELDVSEPEPGVFLIKNESRVYESHVTPAPGLKNLFNVTVRGSEFDVTISDPKRLRGLKDDDNHATGRFEIRTAMPGKVVRILISNGDVVQKGDGVVVVEAMKMQNELKSPKDGTITEVLVAEGDTVGSGDILIVID